MTQLESIIRQKILSEGSISFARFMELALYCPKIGYYEGHAPVVGRRGDFYTSVSVGPLFGELLARKYMEWLGELGADEALLVEAGAHDGQLACDVLDTIKTLRPDVRIRYAIVEPSAERRSWQQGKLELFADKVSWFASLDALPPVTGIIFMNELLDAMPVHILQWRAGRWVELRVTLKEYEPPTTFALTPALSQREREAVPEGEGAFVWQAAELTADLGQPKVPGELATVLPEGFQIEVSPAACRWWRTAATKLARGKLMTFDYGLEEEEVLLPQRAAGTLRAYYRHTLSNDVLARPGEQDITAHVNFTEIRRAGELAGLGTDAFMAQSKFLTEIAAKVSDWPPARVRQFQTLTHAEHLGRSFKVLIQSR